MNEQAPKPSDPNKIAEQKADAAAAAGKWEAFAPAPISTGGLEALRLQRAESSDSGKTAAQAMEDFEKGDEKLHEAIDNWTQSGQPVTGEQIEGDARYVVEHPEIPSQDVPHSA